MPIDETFETKEAADARLEGILNQLIVRYCSTDLGDLGDLGEAADGPIGKGWWLGRLAPYLDEKGFVVKPIPLQMAASMACLMYYPDSVLDWSKSPLSKN
jgi:hypothetical protein